MSISVHVLDNKLVHGPSTCPVWYVFWKLHGILAQPSRAYGFKVGGGNELVHYLSHVEWDLEEDQA